MDSGAIDHICTSMSWFENYHKIPHIPVSLFNGSVVISHLVGDVKSSYALILKSAIFLPEFDINLDPTQRKIDLVKLHNGLDYIKIFFGKSSVSKSNVVFRGCNKNSNIVMSNPVYIPNKLLRPCKDFPLIHVNKNKVCDICHLARQKLPYSVSVNRASMPFEMLHIDIWGPYSLPSIHGHKYFLTIVDDHSKST
ncbi:hypothetical protein CR513_00795, partial [Mucuna pruriens]